MEPDHNHEEVIRRLYGVLERTGHEPHCSIQLAYEILDAYGVFCIQGKGDPDQVLQDLAESMQRGTDAVMQHLREVVAERLEQH